MSKYLVILSDVYYLSKCPKPTAAIMG